MKWGGLISLFVPLELCGFMCQHFRLILLLLVSYWIMSNFSHAQVKENIKPEIDEADSMDIESKILLEVYTLTAWFHMFFFPFSSLFEELSLEKILFLLGKPYDDHPD